MLWYRVEETKLKWSYLFPRIFQLSDTPVPSIHPRFIDRIDWMVSGLAEL